MGLEPTSVISTANWADLLTILMVGLSTAFALQVLLFFLGSAIALSSIRLPSVQSAQEQELSAPNLKLGMISSLGVFSTVNLVLFIASFLSTTFVQFQSPVAGAIAGLVLWAFYLGAMLWLSLITVNSLAEGLLNFVTFGTRRIVLLILNLFKNQEDVKNQKDEQRQIREQIETVIQEEVQTAFTCLEQQLLAQQSQLALSTVATPAVSLEGSNFVTEKHSQLDEASSIIQTIWQEIRSYINNVDDKKLSPKKLDRALQKFFGQLPNTTLIALTALPIPVEELTTVLAQREDLSKKKKSQIIKQIQTTWKTFVEDFNGSTTHLGDVEPLSAQINGSASNVAASPTNPPAAALPSIDAAQLKTVVGEAIVPILEKISSDDFKQPLEQLLASSQIGLSDVNRTLKQQASQLRDRTSDQITSMQQALQQGTQARLEGIQQDLQNRLESTRRSIVRTAWWLFATVLTSGMSAALAGAISAKL